MGIESNTDTFLADLAVATQDIQDGDVIEDAVEQAVEDAVEEIKAEWPSATGRSREGWTGYARGLSASVENTVSYSEYVHGGDAAAEATATFENRMEALGEELEQAIALRLEAVGE